MKHARLFATALFFATPAAAQQAPATDHGSKEDAAAVLATIDTMFKALAAKDAAGIIAVTVPEGRATGTGVTDTGEHRVTSSDWAGFAARLAKIPGKPVERNIDPHVHVDGDIAMVWTPYVFTLDGKFSHCGINHFDLIRVQGAWKVQNVTWTQRKTGCPGQ
ncbi:nuclear transport factor 2 family protein [Sphingomonas sp. So64.6b]|uniref:nuclear transport factor 2 family protein n=1 Tax=Sphingomonas sp. So64.6b TaxID=2997354 RepID=UPI0015FFDE0F|nr:nuclear transport factor 2 family protein [Sphingomonas sp. So64.6b]QNA84505.1 nuclear transport factor 2 family protein [Sphingomonas sp. So64.6b]